MSQTMAASTGVTSQYAAQVTTDLEHNAKEQERISEDIAALQEQLAGLQHDHAVLLNVQQALGIAAVPAQPVAAPETAPVPAPRENAAPGPDTDAGKPAEVTKARGSARAKKQTAKKGPALKPAGKAAGTKEARSTLVDLVRRHLSEQSEPRSAAQLTEALAHAHPQRGIKSTVVRTTVESLVAKGLAHRSKRGSSVFYTSVQDTPAQSATEAEPASE